MKHSIKTVYIVHHSHTDIGYTDLQERVIDCQIDNIHTAISLLSEKENDAFCWNCETSFCVERFLQEAAKEERDAFFRLVRQGRIGVSASYLNFCDLADSDILKHRIAKINDIFQEEDIHLETAMNADINGISMGQRDALLDNGVKFLFTNIHTHHGMYPLYQNQNAYYWENKNGQRLLVWNGEHYNLGNALGIKPNKRLHGMSQLYFGDRQEQSDVQTLHNNLEYYLTELEESGYQQDFVITSVSGVFSDNAPPNADILRTIEAYHKEYGDDVCLRMVTLQRLYEEIQDKIGEIPVYHGDLTDWWANGVGSTPYAVKHYREAQHMYRLAGRLDPGIYRKYPDLACMAEDNLLLYAEHTWGYSASISNPYDTMVVNLDLRKQSYASKAHEAAALLQNRAMVNCGGVLRCYNTDGKVCAINTGDRKGMFLVEFYIESSQMDSIDVENADGNKMKVQLSEHPRGVLVSFVDAFEPHETKCYNFAEIHKETLPSRKHFALEGMDRIRDIINLYDAETCRLPYELENDWFYISYEIGRGFTSFKNKKTGEEMLSEGMERFFTPVYERTILQHAPCEERRLLGRNIRGKHAQVFQGVLTDAVIQEQGPVFLQVEFVYHLEGTKHCSMILKLYRDLPRIDFTLRMAKTLSEDIESVYLPLTLALPDKEIWLEKGAEPFRPGIDQIPGTCMEYWMTDEGIIYRQDKGNILIRTPDTPLVYMGELDHHPICLCDCKPENNQRPVFSWVMNNTWETNFKLDLSGYGEFRYQLELADSNSIEDGFSAMHNSGADVFAYIAE